MKTLKGYFYKFLGKKSATYLNGWYTFFNKWRLLTINYVYDAKMYHSHSSMVKKNTWKKKEATIILHYHAIEKAFLHSSLRFRFGIPRIQILLSLIKSLEKEYLTSSQVLIACECLCKYYEIHQKSNVDISEYFSGADYDFLRKINQEEEDIVHEQVRELFFKKDLNFKDFASSRRSVRNFSGELVSSEILDKVIEIAKTSPSVCNRQPAKVYCIQNKEKLTEVFRLQGGLHGFTEGISQVLILTCDRSTFYSVGERNQLFIDGGLFLMNLLYALHYYNIGACPAHWAKEKDDDIEIKKLLNLDPAEKVICVVPIGIPKENFKTTLSKRRANKEILHFIY